MSYYDWEHRWDFHPQQLRELPLMALRAWRTVLRNPIWHAVEWQCDRERFAAIMDRCDVGRFTPEWAEWIETLQQDLIVKPAYADDLKWLIRYREVIRAIQEVEAREISELIAAGGRAA